MLHWSIIKLLPFDCEERSCIFFKFNSLSSLSWGQPVLRNMKKSFSFKEITGAPGWVGVNSCQTSNRRTTNLFTCCYPQHPQTIGTIKVTFVQNLDLVSTNCNALFKSIFRKGVPPEHRRKFIWSGK